MLRKIVSIILAATFLAYNLVQAEEHALARYLLTQSASENPKEFERLASELAKAWVADATQTLARDGRFLPSDPAVEAELVKQAALWAREGGVPPDKLVAAVSAELSKLRAAQPRPPAVMIGDKSVKSEIVDIIGEEILREAYRKYPDHFKSAIDHLDGSLTGFFSSPALTDTLAALSPHLGRGNIRAAFANSPYEFAVIIHCIKDMGENKFIDFLLPQLGRENFQAAFRDETEKLGWAMEMIILMGVEKFVDMLNALSSLLGRENIERAFRNHPSDLLWVVTRDIKEMGLEAFEKDVLLELEGILDKDTVSKIFGNSPRYLFELRKLLHSEIIPREVIINTEKLLHTLEGLEGLSVGGQQLVKQIILDRAYELHYRGNLSPYEMRKLEETLKTHTIPGVKVAEYIYRDTIPMGAVISVPVRNMEYVGKERLKELSAYLRMLPAHAILGYAGVEKGEVKLRIEAGPPPILAANGNRYMRRGLKDPGRDKVEILYTRGRKIWDILKSEVIPWTILYKSLIYLNITKMCLLTELYLSDNPDQDLMADDIKDKLKPIAEQFRDRLKACLGYMGLSDDEIEIITGQKCDLLRFRQDSNYRAKYVSRALAKLQKAIVQNSDGAAPLVKLVNASIKKVEAALIGKDPLDKKMCGLIEKGRFDDVIPELKEASGNSATREHAKELLQIAESGAPPRDESSEWEPAAKPASEVADVEQLTRETAVHMLLHPEGQLDLSKIAIVAKRGLADSFSSGKDAVLGETLEQEYQRMSQNLRKLFGNGEGIVEIAPEDRAELPNTVNSLISQGFKVIVLDDGALTEGLTEGAIRGKAGENYCVISAESEEGLDNTTIQFLNLNAMAFMGVGILHNDEILFETAYRLFTGADPSENALTSLRQKALWLIQALPRIIKFRGGIDDRDSLKRLFASSA